MAMEGGLPDLEWIAADWGTSALRVWAMDARVSVLARSSSDAGMGKLKPDEFEPALLHLIGEWLPPAGGKTVPVTVCGMAGARQGWTEAPYRAVPCTPVGAGELAPVCTGDGRIAVAIVPGLSQSDPPDVMRGEETQLAGLVARIGAISAIVCIPGTHSKWVRLEGGQVTDFTTFMTGEAFALLAEKSVLRHSVDGEGEDRAAFLSGVADALDAPERVTASLFAIRAASLLKGTSGVSARSRLSGLLIGVELAATREHWRDNPVHLIGAPQLAALYATALQHAGVRPMIEDTEALTLAGLAAANAARTGQIVQPPSIA